MDIDINTDPPPDIAVEIDINHDSRSRFSIYAGLGVPEVWRYDGRQMSIHHLQQDEYAWAEASLAVPILTSSVLTESLAKVREEGQSHAIVAFDEWLSAPQASN
jgi:Uma2 family endonuclease